MEIQKPDLFAIIVKNDRIYRHDRLNSRVLIAIFLWQIHIILNLQQVVLFILRAMATKRFTSSVEEQIQANSHCVFVNKDLTYRVATWIAFRDVVSLIYKARGIVNGSPPTQAQWTCFDAFGAILASQLFTDNSFDIDFIVRVAINIPDGPYTQMTDEIFANKGIQMQEDCKKIFIAICVVVCNHVEGYLEKRVIGSSIIYETEQYLRAEFTSKSQSIIASLNTNSF